MCIYIYLYIYMQEIKSKTKNEIKPFLIILITCLSKLLFD